MRCCDCCGQKIYEPEELEGCVIVDVIREHSLGNITGFIVKKGNKHMKVYIINTWGWCLPEELAKHAEGLTHNSYIVYEKDGCIKS